MSTSTPDKISSGSQEVRNPILISALAYGAGMVVGSLLIFLLFKSPIADWILGPIKAQQPLWVIVVGLLIFLLFVGLGGAAAGAWGGLALSRFSGATSEKQFVRRGALSFFLAHAIVILPAIVMVIALVYAVRRRRRQDQPGDSAGEAA